MVIRSIIRPIIRPIIQPIIGGDFDDADPAFQITVKTDNAGTSNNDQFTLPASGTYDIDWGDGTTQTGLTGAQTHTYPSAGNYVIRITNWTGVPAVTFNNGGDRLKLLEIQNWGITTWATFENAFFNCSNLQITATDKPDSGGVSNFARAWQNCSSMQTFPLIDTSSGTNFLTTWLLCTGLTAFPEIDIQNGENLQGTWNGCSGLTSFPVLDFRSMTNGLNCFLNTTIPTETWSQILINTEANNQNNNVTFHGGNATYNTAGGVARAALIADHTWTITDGGAA